MNDVLATRVVLDVSSWNRAKLRAWLDNHNVLDPTGGRFVGWDHGELVGAVLDTMREAS